MKIAVNARFLLKGRLEGLGWYSHEILRRMVQSHPEDDFYFFFDRPFDASFIYGKNVVPVVLNPPARHPLLWYLWFEWSIPRALQKINADVFFSPDTYLSLGTGTPTVLTVHDLIPLERPKQIPYLARKYYQYFLPKYVQRAAHLIAISHDVRKTVLRLSTRNQAEITVAYNGVRSEFKQISEKEQKEIQEKYASGQPYIFYTGSLNKRKNIDRLIQAFDAFKQRTKSSVKLLIAGKKGWEIAEIEAAYAQALWKDDIEFLGYVENNEQVRLMAACDLFTYLSLDEGFGLPLLEAMKCGVPVLASDIPVFREVAGEAVFYANPKDRSAIGESIERLLSDRLYAKSKMEIAAKQVGKYSWDTAAATVYTALKKFGSG